MRKLRIGYQALSKDLSHPGDRRRVVFWAEKRGHEIVTDLNQKVDVILLSEKSDFGAFPEKARGVPIIFDLIDGYLAPENSVDDLIRGTSKVMTRQLTGKPQRFTTFVKNLCFQSNAVICSTPEQLATIAPYSKNIHVILDSHEELPMLPYGRTPTQRSGAQQILWEGLPATLGGLQQIQQALNTIQLNIGFNINFVTDTSYFHLLGKFVRGETSSLLKHVLGELYSHSQIVPWSVKNLVDTAEESSLAIIPIKLRSSLQYLKPENRLLIMWRLGLPCLTSPTPAYMRVSNEAGSDTICRSVGEWEMKLSWLLKNGDAAEEIVRNGQSYINKFHNSEVILEKWDNAFQSVL